MSIKVKVSPRIVGNIAKLYQSTSRIFMEYIDNSLDSAEELFEENNKKYPYQILINIKIDPDEKSITFEDNCMGMDKNNLLRVVENIGDSTKKNDFIKNGKFGFGVHAYAACADRMEISTLMKDSSCVYKIQVDRSAYTEDGEIPDLVEMPIEQVNFGSGTIIKLTHFDNDWWKDVTPHELKDEIEKHFEQVLTRDLLQIKISYGTKKRFVSLSIIIIFLAKKSKKI